MLNAYSWHTREQTFQAINPHNPVAVSTNFVVHTDIVTTLSVWWLQISEWRHGEVAEAEADLVVIKPTEGEGSQAQHPIAANSSAEELEEEEEEEEEEGANVLLMHAPESALLYVGHQALISACRNNGKAMY